MVALDANRDGELSAKEIENAVVALKKLDKNKDGKLTPEELRPQFGGPGGPGGPGFGGPPRPEGDRPRGQDQLRAAVGIGQAFADNASLRGAQ